MTASLPTSPIYLVELMDPYLASFDKADVTGYLDNAVDAVSKHLADFAEPITAQVSIDKTSKELAGILFFNEASEVIAVIRPYYLSREIRECTDAAICELSTVPADKLEKSLKRIFKG